MEVGERSFIFPPEGVVESVPQLEARVVANAGAGLSPEALRQAARDQARLRGSRTAPVAPQSGKTAFEQAALLAIKGAIGANITMARHHDIMHAVAGMYSMVQAESAREWAIGLTHVALVAFKRLRLANYADDFLRNVAARYEDPQILACGPDFSLGDLWRAFVDGKVLRSWPAWVRHAIDVLYKLTAVGIVGTVVGRLLLPKALLEWASGFQLPEGSWGSIVVGVESAIKDLYRRIKIAVSTGSLYPIFSPLLGQ